MPACQVIQGRMTATDPKWSFATEVYLLVLETNQSQGAVVSESGAESWEVLTTCADQFTAEAQAGLLRNDGIPVDVRMESSLPGLVSEARIFVPSLKLDRARWIIRNSEVSEEELYLAATGEPITRDEESTTEIDAVLAGSNQLDETRRRNPYTKRMWFFGFVIGAAYCYWAAVQGWPGPWLGTSRLLLALASYSAIWALIEALTSDKPPKLN